jgi:hypothetical protein
MLIANFGVLWLFDIVTVIPTIVPTALKFWANGIALNLTTLFQPITVQENSSLAFSTFALNRSSVMASVKVRITCATSFPLNVAMLMAISPVPLSTFRSALDASTFVGAHRWDQYDATYFTDRYIVHWDSARAALPARVVANCTIVAGTSNQLDCILPNDLVGSFWQVMIGWCVPLADGTKVWGNSIFTAGNLANYTGGKVSTMPLTFSLPIWTIPPFSTSNATLTTNLAQRFMINPYTNTRSPPGGFNPIGNSLNNGFDNFFGATTSASGVRSFPSVPLVPEILYIPAKYGFFPRSSLDNLRVFIVRYVQLWLFFFSLFVFPPPSAVLRSFQL